LRLEELLDVGQMAHDEVEWSSGMGSEGKYCCAGLAMFTRDRDTFFRAMGKKDSRICKK